ncbi:MAG: hypothetical protein KBH86_06595 [Syntrophorhabdus sp.]|nr:hypothetical protein [Syntrophorhabdus sp.]
MIEIELEPGLSHCIETVTKIEYERVLSLLLKGKEEDARLAEELELLRVFLESAGFSQLRCRCEERLAAGKRALVRLMSSSLPPKYRVEFVET